MFCIKTGCTIFDKTTKKLYHGDLYLDKSHFILAGCYEIDGLEYKGQDYHMEAELFYNGMKNKYHVFSVGNIFGVLQDFFDFVSTWVPHLLSDFPQNFVVIQKRSYNHV